MTRVSDAYETRFSFATRKDPTPLDRVKSLALRTYLARRRGFDVGEMCLSFIGYEGTGAPRRRPAQARPGGSSSRHGGLCIGASPGELYDQKKFDTPYIRDFLLDRGTLADVSETAAPWSALRPLYDAVTAAARGAFDELGVRGYIMCHLSHSYHAGACLYFTFAFEPRAGRATPLEQYARVKSAIQQAFVDNGATLSHHHAVGTEHARVARAGHLRARASRCCARCSTGWTRAATSTRGRSCDARRRRGRAAAPAGAVRELLLSARASARSSRCTPAGTVTGREHSTGCDGPVAVRRQPLEPHGHAADAAGAAVALAAADRGGRGGRLLLRRARCWRTPCRWPSAPCPSSARGAPRRARPSSTRLLGDGWSLVVYAEGTRSRDGDGRAAARRRRGARGRARAADRARARVRDARHDAGRPQLDAARRPGCAAGRSRVAFGPADPPAAGEHRTEVMERVRPFFEACRAPTTTPDKRAAARPRPARPPGRWRASSSPGGSGFIGGALCARAASSAGDEVVARSPARDAAAATVAARGAEARRGDVLDEDALAAAMAGCAVAYHVAGVNTHCPSDPDELMRVNVDGTEAMSVPRRAPGVAARGLDLLGRVGRRGRRARSGARTPPHRGSYLSLYDRSKHEGEQAAFAAGGGWASRSWRSTPPPCRAPAARPATARSSSPTSTGSCRAFVDTTSAWSTSPTSSRPTCWPPSAAGAGARYVLNGATIPSPEALALVSELSGVTDGCAWCRPALARAVGGAGRGRGPCAWQDALALPRARTDDPPRAPVRRLARDARAGPRVHAAGRHVLAHDRLGRRRGPRHAPAARAHPAGAGFAVMGGPGLEPGTSCL